MERVISMFLMALHMIALVGLGAGARDCDFESNHIIPNYADFVKSKNVEVDYNGREVKCGQSIPFLATTRNPTIFFNRGKCCKLFTVLLFVPRPVVNAPFVVWLVHNIPRHALADGFSGGAGDERYPYDIPIHVTGMDPNTVFVYCQKNKVTDNQTVINRYAYNVKERAKSYNLGNPVGGTFFKLKAV